MKPLTAVSKASLLQRFRLVSLVVAGVSMIRGSVSPPGCLAMRIPILSKHFPSLRPEAPLLFYHPVEGRSITNSRFDTLRA